MNSFERKIKSTCNYVYQQSKHVKINTEKLIQFVNSHLDFFENIPSWSSGHFNSNEFYIEMGLSYVFVIDSLNFCFWPCELLSDKYDFEYENLVNNLYSLMKSDSSFFNAKSLSELTVEDLKIKVFLNKEFPLLEERTRSLNELGQYIMLNYDGKFYNFVKNNCDCIKIALKISEGVSTFRDETIFEGKQIFLYKRAQILAADLYSYLLDIDSDIHLTNVDKLTTFPDYRVPQILREMGIMEYDSDLSSIIDNKIQILPNSREEIEIRANTIICVEMIKDEIFKIHNKTLYSIHIDYVLWNEGEKLRTNIKPHHRTLTIFY